MDFHNANNKNNGNDNRMIIEKVNAMSLYEDFEIEEFLLKKGHIE